MRETYEELLVKLVELDDRSEDGKPPSPRKWAQMLNRLHKQWETSVWLNPWGNDRYVRYLGLDTTLEIYSALSDCQWRKKTHPDTPGLDRITAILEYRLFVERAHLLPVFCQFNY